MKTFTVCRRADVSGVSGTGIIVEGIIFSDGTCVVHWLGIVRSTAVYPSYNAFAQVHIEPHPENRTIVTFSDGQHIET